MKNEMTLSYTNKLAAIITLAAFALSVSAADPAGSPGRAEPSPVKQGNLSLRNEVLHAISKGIRFLEKTQAENGSWSDPDHPGVTALVLTGCMGDPSGSIQKKSPAFIQRGYSFLLSSVQPDGGIYGKNLQNYNTSLAVLALVAAEKPEYRETILRARDFIVGQQNDFGEPGTVDNVLDGGIGYGGSRAHADMANTLAALEALYRTREIAADAPEAEVRKLNWQAAIQFIERCQNLPAHNDQSWASADPANRGGFVYHPGFSQAGEMPLEGSGRVALRSYGSISYAGLLSYIYADVERDDPRVLAVYDWLRENYTLEENPGMGLQGLFYYYHTMAKALSTYGVEVLQLSDGRQIRWREDLAKRLINLQQTDGSWVNENGRWWEKDPALVTAYSLVALEFLAQGL